MQTFGDSVKDALYNAIISGEYGTVTAVKINGVMYSESEIVSVATLVDTADAATLVGNAVSGSVDIKMIKPDTDIPRMAKIEVLAKVTDGLRESDYLPMGVFYVDTRSETHSDTGLDYLTLSGYDSMLKADQAYSSGLTFPATDIAVVRDIAAHMGVGIDPRTVDIIVNRYAIQLPSQFTMREVLAYIAAMYAGNFIINPAGNLRLVRINEMPKETNYLITESGNAITFGEVRILV